ncbi:MAG TPA: hypothetical protein PKH07_04410 [bacterium]|nr:hypothetical protein [bacterium]
MEPLLEILIEMILVNNDLIHHPEILPSEMRFSDQIGAADY